MNLCIFITLLWNGVSLNVALKYTVHFWMLARLSHDGGKRLPDISAPILWCRSVLGRWVRSVRSPDQRPWSRGRQARAERAATSVIFQL